MIPSWKYPIFFVAIAIAWKLVLFYTGLGRSQWEEYGIFLYVLLLLVSILFTIKKVKTADSHRNFIFRQGLTAGLVFSLFFSGFVLIYYSFIDPEYFTDKLDISLAAMHKQGASEEEMITYYSTGRSMVMNPVSHATYSFFGLMFLSMLYAAILTMLSRKRVF